MLLRAPQDHIIDASMIFSDLNGHLSALSLLNSQPLKSLDDLLVYELSHIQSSERTHWECFIFRPILSYVNTLAKCCWAEYNRELSPRALKARDVSYEEEPLYKTIREVSDLLHSTELIFEAPMSTQRRLGLIDRQSQGTLPSATRFGQ